MVDLNTPLGRPVPTAAQIASIIRGSLRLAAVIGPAFLDAMRDGRLRGTPDLDFEEGNDEHAEDAIFEALVAAGMENVKEWAFDVAVEPGETFGLVYDKEKVTEFVRSCVREAFAGTLDPALLEY